MLKWFKNLFKPKHDPKQYWIADHEISYSQMTFEQKCELFVDMFANLDPTSTEGTAQLFEFLQSRGVTISGGADFAKFELESYLAFKKTYGE